MGLFIKSRRKAGAGRGTAWALSLWGQRRRIATVAAAGLTVAVGYHVVFGANGLTVYGKKRVETQTLTKQLHDLEQENESLRGHVGRLQMDPNAIEHEAREELHYTRPGEVIITLPATDKAHLTKPTGQQ
jgi:cell division protein FtsB